MDRGAPFVLDRPEPGWWMLRLRASAPEVPAMIAVLDHEPGDPDNKLDRWPLPLWAEIAGQLADPLTVWAQRKRPISPEEYAYQRALCLWTREHAPDEPLAQPRKKTDWLQAVLPF